MIKEQCKLLLENNTTDEYLLNDASKIRSPAIKVRQSGIQTVETSFMILCRKPKRRIYPNGIATRANRSPRLRFRHFLAQIDARLFGSYGRKTWKTLEDRSRFPR